MNHNRPVAAPIISPATGTRGRIGNVVRWHAEPVASAEEREPAEAPAQPNGTASKPSPKPV